MNKLKSGSPLLLVFLMLAANISFICATNSLSQNSSIEHKDGDVQLTDVYVSTTGNDNGNGTSSDPFKSLSKAISIVDSNGNIHLANGSYNGQLNKNLTINKNVSILSDGNDVIIDGESLEKIFTTQDFINLNVEGIFKCQC